MAWGMRRTLLRRQWGMRMRHRNVWAAGLALGLGMGVVGLVRGQEPPRSGTGILDRLFTASPVPVVPADAKKETSAKPLPAAPPSMSRAQALNDFLRRLAVCDKLGRIAELHGDEALMNTVKVLEMRAKDIYVQRTNPGAMAITDEDVLERQLAPNGRNLTPLSATTSKSGSNPAYAEGRR
jgi:hypothetical protein